MPGPANGYRGAFQQPSQWGRNESGNFDTWVYEGTREEVARLAATFAQIIGLAYNVSDSYGKSKLEVYFPWNMRGINPATDLVSKWELFSSAVEKDLLAARIENGATIAQLSPTQIATLRFYVQNPPSTAQGGSPYPTATDFQTAGETNGALALQILVLLLQGVTSWPVEAPSLRRTITTSNQYALSYALTNIGKIISTASLKVIEGVPNGLLFNLPEYSWVETNPNFTTLAFAFGWRKKYPTVQQVALLKWNIVQEWDYGYWTTLMYGNPL